MGTKTKIWVSFFGMRKGEPGWPNIDFDPEKRKEELLQTLKENCENIEFVGREMILDFEELRKVEQKKDIDGILVFTLATRPAGLVSWCLRKQELSEFRNHPMIIVADLFGGEEMLLDFYSVAQANSLPVIAIMSSDLTEVKSALHLFETIHHVKGSKILNLTDGKDPDGQSGWWGRNYEGYLNQLKELLGIEVVTIGSKQINQYYKVADEKSAHQLASQWISKAVKVIEPSKEEIVKSGRMYLVIKKLMEEREASTVTMDCLGLYYDRKLPAYPCLAFMQLNNEGFTGICESDMEATVTQLLMRELTGLPGFVSDPVLDTSAGQIIYAHCTAPTKLFGQDGPVAPYIIRSHAEDRKSACPQVIMPVGKPITTVKISLREKKISLHQGKSVGNVNNERGCRTKLVAEANVERIMENYKFGTFGWHRVSFYGDFAREVRQLSKLLGLQVVEES